MSTLLTFKLKIFERKDLEQNKLRYIGHISEPTFYKTSIKQGLMSKFGAQGPWERVEGRREEGREEEKNVYLK